MTRFFRLSIWPAFFIILSAYLLFIFGDYNIFRIDGELYYHTADDHMITMRVAENFSRYGTPYFNHDEPVAANTSLFWPMILGTLIFHKGQASAVAANIIISVLLSSVTIFFASQFLKDRLHQCAAVLLLSLSPTYLTYGATGWEHIPQATLVTLAFYLIMRRSTGSLEIPNLAVIMISISFLFRPDSAVAIAIIGLVWLVHGKRFLKFGTLALGIGLLTLPALYIYLMIDFYGDWLPNTAYLKSAGFTEQITRGLAYILNPGASGIVPALTFGLFLIRPKTAFAKLILCVAMAHIAYVVIAGGDVFGDGRFFLILLPIVTATLFAELERQFSPKAPASDRHKLALAMVVLLMAWNAPSGLRALKPEGPSDVEEQIRLAHVFNSSLPETAGSIGLHYLGIGFHLPKFHIVDFLGKAEPYISRTPIRSGPVGHNRWDYEYAFENYDIAAFPIQDSTVDRVTKPNYQLIERDWVFWEVAALHASQTGNYTYLPAKVFGNENMGAFVRNDLMGHLRVAKDLGQTSR